MRAAIHQPNYAPWCGYFAKMAHSDVFIFLDDVQMPSGRSYVSRCQVRAPGGPQWLSIPTHHAPDEPILTVAFADTRWPRKHLGTLNAHYARAPAFAEVRGLIAPLYQAPGERLCDFNMALIRALAGYLGIACRLVRASELRVGGKGDDHLIALCRAAGATTYLSGPGGQNYQDPAKFAAQGLALEVRTYHPLPYPQLHGEFVPGLSLLDALFHLGRDARDLLTYAAT